MSYPVASDVLTQARSLLGDDLVSGGEIYTDTILFPYLQASTRELIRALAGIQSPRFKQEAYFNLPANTGTLYPSTMGVTDMGEPETVEERTVGDTFTVVGCSITGGVPTLEFDAGSQLVVWGVDMFGQPYIVSVIISDGSRTVVWGVGGVSGVNGAWAITNIDPTHATLNGAVAAGTYTSGGYMSTSPERFQDMDNVDRIDEAEGYGDDRLRVWAWRNGALRFRSCGTARQLRVVYWSSSSTLASTASTIEVEDSLDFLATRTAALAAAARGAPSIAQALNTLAVGPKVTEADGSGGLLRQLVASCVLGMQRQAPLRRMPFRSPRHGWPGIY
jgi:hypothetical protein